MRREEGNSTTSHRRCQTSWTWSRLRSKMVADILCWFLIFSRDKSLSTPVPGSSSGPYRRATYTGIKNNSDSTTSDSHDGLFLCVFSIIVYIINIVSFRAEAILFLAYIFWTVGNTRYGKWHNSRTETPFWLQFILEEGLVQGNRFVKLPNQVDIFFNPKNAAETSAILFTLPSNIGQLKKITSSRAIDIVWHWTSATMPTTHISTGSSLERSPA